MNNQFNTQLLNEAELRAIKREEERFSPSPRIVGETCIDLKQSAEIACILAGINPSHILKDATHEIKLETLKIKKYREDFKKEISLQIYCENKNKGDKNGRK